MGFFVYNIKNHYIMPRQKGSKNNQYVNNKDLYYEIVVSQATGNLTRKAQQMFILMGKGIIKKFYYKSEELKEDCLSAGYEHLFDPQKWMSFDSHYTNAFSYFTEVFKRAVTKGFYESTLTVKLPAHVRQQQKKDRFIRLGNEKSDGGIFSL